MLELAGERGRFDNLTIRKGILTATTSKTGREVGKQEMTRISERVRAILTRWNPLAVPAHIAGVEYDEYMPMILACLHDQERLANCIEGILINDLGTGYDPSLEEHVRDLERVCAELIRTSDGLSE